MFPGTDISQGLGVLFQGLGTLFPRSRTVCAVQQLTHKPASISRFLQEEFDNTTRTICHVSMSRKKRDVFLPARFKPSQKSRAVFPVVRTVMLRPAHFNEPQSARREGEHLKRSGYWTKLLATLVDLSCPRNRCSRLSCHWNSSPIVLHHAPVKPRRSRSARRISPLNSTQSAEDHCSADEHHAAVDGTVGPVTGHPCAWWYA